MKISEKKFRNIISNALIFIILISLILITSLEDVIGVINPNSYSVVSMGNKNNKNISLMFNVYQGQEYIDEILDVLKKYNASATFFVGGCWAVKNEDIINKIINYGHEIGNHGYWHKDHKVLSQEKNASEIQLTHKIIKELCNYEMKLFAPPSGSYSSTTLKVAQELGYITIMWSKDTIDWRDQDSELIFKRATKNLSNGDLVLMHPTKATLYALNDILSFYSQSGYNSTTVSKNIF